MEELREDIQPLVDVYVNFRANAEKYQAEILPSILSVGQILYSHAFMAKSYYDELYSYFGEFGESEVDPEWSREFMRYLLMRMIMQIEQIYEKSGSAAMALQLLKRDIDDNKKVVAANLLRLETGVERHSRSKDASGIGSTAKDNPQGKPSTLKSGTAWSVHEKATFLKTIKVQNGLLDGLLDNILKNAEQAITIIESMHSQFKVMLDKFTTLKEKADNFSEPLPKDLLTPEPLIAFNQWETVKADAATYIQSARIDDTASDDASDI